MGARRLTAVNWQESFEDVLSRGGSVELAIDRSDSDGQTAEPGIDVMWRVRIRDVREDAIMVNHFSAHGREIVIRCGVPLRGSLSIGQNRWLFRTRVVQSDGYGLVLDAPEGLTREARRNSDRVSTRAVELPPLRGWVLMDPLAAIPAEIACAELLADWMCQQCQGHTENGGSGPSAGSAGITTSSGGGSQIEIPETAVLPESGPGFSAKLMNIGGGGLGAILTTDEARQLRSGHLHFLRLNLQPLLPIPLDLTARLAYTHVGSDQSVRAGFAFEFGLHAAHRDVVTGALAQCMRGLESRLCSDASQNEREREEAA